ncbi:hypothetical protein FG386_002016, partial [Cryptosporidium ryanae]|uniref:uncharacterized protein n=1 Tax=Cryptosporidium ryanae TaxID=515981 RepID=UPI00351A1EE3
GSSSGSGGSQDQDPSQGSSSGSGGEGQDPSKTPAVNDLFNNIKENYQKLSEEEFKEKISELKYIYKTEKEKEKERIKKKLDTLKSKGFKEICDDADDLSEKINKMYSEFNDKHRGQSTEDSNYKSEKEKLDKEIKDSKAKHKKQVKQKKENLKSDLKSKEESEKRRLMNDQTDFDAKVNDLKSLHKEHYGRNKSKFVFWKK